MPGSWVRQRMVKRCLFLPYETRHKARPGYQEHCSCLISKDENPLLSLTARNTLLSLFVLSKRIGFIKEKESTSSQRRRWEGLESPPEHSSFILLLPPTYPHFFFSLLREFPFYGYWNLHIYSYDSEFFLSNFPFLSAICSLGYIFQLKKKNNNSGFVFFNFWLFQLLFFS